MILEAAYAMLACARIGAIHSVVFGGFSPEALAGRINDCDSHYVITADGGIRGGKPIPLKENTDKALEQCANVQKVFVVKHTNADISWVPDRDIWYHEAVEKASANCHARGPTQGFSAPRTQGRDQTMRLLTTHRICGALPPGRRARV